MKMESEFEGWNAYENGDPMSYKIRFEYNSEEIRGGFGVDSG